ncbi:helix-turn-helix transcriptional regulator [Altererythrobacter sp. SALINAS58]|uniref:helix-turn-helix domain-containing protein n=1 Tax=Alteripontixanthobacter muriae TaxID=2705546 RepID=UPI0015768351|nr:helix-turn-helix transcriptional regulator [Alteripontixanthobacter muriae]NTZ43213.1 helix-turn-helix transcriptional regulator [Alteripontixanthobacter muriae]
MDVRKRVGTNLRRLRSETGLSQERFALEHGFDRTYISGIERGARNPTIQVVQRIAEALEIDVMELFARPAE